MGTRSVEVRKTAAGCSCPTVDTIWPRPSLTGLARPTRHLVGLELDLVSRRLMPRRERNKYLSSDAKYEQCRQPGCHCRKDGQPGSLPHANHRSERINCYHSNHV